MRTTYSSGEALPVYPLINPHDYVDTGFRLIPLADFKEQPVKHGRYDATTGQVVWDEGGATQTALPEVLARPRNKPTGQRAATGRGNKLNPITDPRRAKVLELYAQGASICDIIRDCHMQHASAKAILQAAGVFREGGTEAHRQQSITMAKLTTDQVRQILASRSEPVPVLMERYGVSRTSIGNILSGKSWRHVGRQTQHEPNPPREEWIE